MQPFHELGWVHHCVLGVSWLWQGLWPVCRSETQCKIQWFSWVPDLYVLLVVCTFAGFTVSGRQGVTKAVINVSFLLEMLQGFNDPPLYLQGWITLDDSVLVSVIQNQLHLPCVLLSVHDHCSSAFVCRDKYNVLIPLELLDCTLLLKGLVGSWGFGLL